MIRDGDINGLKVKILPLNGGEFYHFGTSREMISSSLALQNRVYDQRLIMHRKIKPNPAILRRMPWWTLLLMRATGIFGLRILLLARAGLCLQIMLLLGFPK